MRISVIITTYNRAHVVGEAIESVLAQTRAPDEIIVVDDGSADDTLARLAAFEGRITVIAKANGGVSSARNAGIAAATGEWVTFLDDDDIWYPERLAILERDVREASPEIVAHLANIQWIAPGENREQMDLYDLQAPRDAAVRVEDFFLQTLRGVSFNTLACRRAVALRIGLNEGLRVHEDTLFAGMLAHRHPWLVTRALVSTARRVEGDQNSLTQISSRHLAQRLEHMVGVVDRLLNLDLAPQTRRRLKSHRHFLLLKKTAWLVDANCRRKAIPAGARAAFSHPSALKGVLKVLPVLLLGKSGMRRRISC
jgi:glycosyltransferase involved in cell wall biosynthesis